MNIAFLNWEAAVVSECGGNFTCISEPVTVRLSNDEERRPRPDVLSDNRLKM